MIISEKKFAHLEQLSDKNNVIAALAIDQRGSMEKMFSKLQGEDQAKAISRYKALVAEELTKYASSILLDPIYGLEAIDHIDKDAGLLMSYEVTGFRDDHRRLDLIEGLSVRRIKEMGADAVKILLYYDVDDCDKNNDIKKAAVERVGDECDAQDIPYFLEILTYDNKITDKKEFAKVKARKVNEAMREFSKPQYKIDVLKMEVPIDPYYTEGFTDGEFVTSKEEAKQAFLDQTNASHLPYIFLSAGVPMDMFTETLRFAKDAGAEFHGVLCGRATWKDGVDIFIEDQDKGLEWLQTQGKENILSLNKVIEEVSTPWTSRLEK